MIKDPETPCGRGFITDDVSKYRRKVYSSSGVNLYDLYIVLTP